MRWLLSVTVLTLLVCDTSLVHAAEPCVVMTLDKNGQLHCEIGSPPINNSPRPAATDRPSSHQKQPLTIQDVLLAFGQFETRLKTDISHDDYAAAIDELSDKLKLFSTTLEAYAHAEAANKLKNILADFRLAKELWSLRLGRYSSRPLSRHSDLGNSLLKRYPQATKPVDQGGALSRGESIAIQHLLPIMWSDASKQLSEARVKLEATKSH